MINEAQKLQMSNILPVDNQELLVPAVDKIWLVLAFYLNGVRITPSL